MDSLANSKNKYTIKQRLMSDGKAAGLIMRVGEEEHHSPACPHSTSAACDLDVSVLCFCQEEAPVFTFHLNVFLSRSKYSTFSFYK